MHAVVNTLRLAKPIPDEIWARAEQEVGVKARTIEGFRGMQVVRLAEDEIVLLVFADDAPTLDVIATEVGGPWMVANVIPYLAGPPQRRVGEVVVDC
jgi:hypothetical protein